jgi:hypothetical protein
MNEPMRVILDLLDTANARVRDAVSEGRLDNLRELMAEVTDLEKQRDALFKDMTRPATAEPTYAPLPSLRVRVISTLRLVQRPLAARLVTQIARTRFDYTIDVRALASMRRDEQRSFRAYADNPDAAQRKGELVVPGLSFDRYTPVRSVLALSDWDLSRRLIAPASPRVDVLSATHVLAKLVIANPDQRWARPVEQLVGTIGRSLAPFAHRTEVPTPQMVRAAAEAELAVIEPSDRAERQDAAIRARAQLPEEEQLFGANTLGVVNRRAS